MLETGVELEDPPTSPRILLVLELNFISVSVCFPHFLICSACDHPFCSSKSVAHHVLNSFSVSWSSVWSNMWIPLFGKKTCLERCDILSHMLRQPLPPTRNIFLHCHVFINRGKKWLQSLRMQETQLNRCMRLRSLSILRHVTRITSWSMRHVGMYPKIQWIATFVSL